MGGKALRACPTAQATIALQKLMLRPSIKIEIVVVRLQVLPYLIILVNWPSILPSFSTRGFGPFFLKLGCSAKALSHTKKSRKCRRIMGIKRCIGGLNIATKIWRGVDRVVLGKDFDTACLTTRYTGYRGILLRAVGHALRLVLS